MQGYIFLLIAIIGEIIATTSLKASEGFTRLVPSIVVIIGYAIAFYMLSLALKYIPLGISYALWSGIGTAITVFVGVLVYGEKLSPQIVIGILLIIAGVIVLNLTKATA